MLTQQRLTQYAELVVDYWAVYDGKGDSWQGLYDLANEAIDNAVWFDERPDPLCTPPQRPAYPGPLGVILEAAHQLRQHMNTFDGNPQEFDGICEFVRTDVLESMLYPAIRLQLEQARKEDRTRHTKPGAHLTAVVQ